MIPDDDEGELVEDDAADLEAVLDDPEEEEGGGGGEGEGEAAPVDKELAGEDAPPAEEGGEAPAEDVEGDFPFDQDLAKTFAARVTAEDDSETEAI